MSKVYLFAVMLLAASFTGCIEEADDLQKTTSSDEEETNGNDEEETLEPVGEDNMSSLEKRVSDLEAIITEYELPKVYFLNLNENNYTYLGYDNFEFSRSDDGYLNCYYSEFYDSNSCMIYAFYYDVNGMVHGYSWEGSETEIEPYSGFCQEGTEPLICASPAAGSGGWLPQDVCSLAAVNQTLTLRVYDNDGNEASASYELDYWTNCERSYVPGQVPEISFFVQEGSDGVYHVDIISVTESYPLEDYSFFLKDETGSTYVGAGLGFGEIAMQIIGGQEHGIDTSYEDKGGTDQQLIDRANNVTNDDGAVYPVHFQDNDRDGTLSAGDRFMVYGSGNSASGPASDNWRLVIQFDSTGDIVGSATML
jgi:hypothetical protein